MGMTIEDSIEVIKHEKPERPTSLYGIMKKNAFNTAIEIMRKYQKIEQIVSDFKDYQKAFNVDFGGDIYMKMVNEVVEDATN